MPPAPDREARTGVRSRARVDRTGLAISARTAPPGPQQLLPVDTTPNIAEALEARIKDPLWYLTMQWLTGEFAAESGGSIGQVEIALEAAPVSAIVRGAQTTPIDLNAPLEQAVEGEDAQSVAAAWDPERLEYAFRLQVQSAELVAPSYDGERLDWFHFDLARDAKAGALAAPAITRVLPRNLRFRGMPHPRWWRLDDGDIDLTLLGGGAPNFLAVLLPEFLMIDSNNWYVVPLEQTVGTLRHITRLTAIDGFGFARELSPVLSGWGTGGWEVFTHTPADKTSVLDGSFFFLPHHASHLVQGDPIEDVEFIRDEGSNTVWAVERRYRRADGVVINRADEEAQAPGGVGGLADPGALSADLRGLPIFRLKSTVARHWIPYLPRRLPTPDPTGAQIYLRRARSDESANRANPQYRSQIVAESWRLFEEEVPRTGLRAQRRWRFARGTDGSDHFWVGRRTTIGRAERTAGLDFDFLLDARARP